jgi:hypothetical protein
MKNVLTLILVGFFIQANCQQKLCDKCDLRYLNYVNKNFKNLSETVVERFLCSLDYACNLNPQFTQASNKMIYAILETKPELIIACLQKYNYLNKKYIIEQIRNPFVKQNFDIAYKKVRSAIDSSQIKNQISGSIKIAALKYKIKL